MLRDMLWNVVFIIKERAKIIFPFPLFRRRLPQELFKKIILKAFPKSEYICALLWLAIVHFSHIEYHLKLVLLRLSVDKIQTDLKNNGQMKFKK